MQRDYGMEYIDLRSDTVTWPTPKMKEAMLTCKLGDDVYGDDPTVKELEELSAKTLGKEAGLFVPCGTFGNQLCVFAQTSQGDEVIAAEDTHLVLNECGGLGVIAGIQLRALRTNKGQMDPKEVESKIRKTEQDIHYPNTSLICLENAHSNGRVLTLEHMEEIYNVAKKHNVNVHLDGARIFNAAASLNVDPKEVAKYCDTLTFCLSKGLCCPAGAIVCGSKSFIAKARSKRKLMGGGLRQVGMLAAPGIVAFSDIIPEMPIDHKMAKQLATEMGKMSWITTYPEDVQISMVLFDVTDEKVKPEELIKFFAEKGIKIRPPKKGGKWRFVTHHYVREKEVERILSALNEFYSALSLSA
jgi:threonine aldolase